MEREAVCDLCGRTFDIILCEQMYDQKFGPEYTYDNFDAPVCMGCAIDFTNKGLARSNFQGGDDGM